MYGSKTYLRRWIVGVPVVCALLLSACRPGGAEEDPLVARVGPIEITASDFVMSYEFGFNVNKRGPDPRRAYLDRMIEEALMSAEGYRLGLDEAPEVKRREASLREELLVEQVFERRVNDHITVTDDDIIQAMQQDRVSFKVRYLPAVDHASAARLKEEVERDGFESALDRLIAQDVENRWNSVDFESPYITSHDLHPVLMSAISELPVGEFTDPVAYRGQFLILQVIDIRREPIPPVTDAAERSRYEQVVFQQKAKAEARRLIGEVMGPRQVEIRSQPFLQMRDALWEWYRTQPPAVNLKAAIDRSGDERAEAIRALYEEELISSTDGTWSVGEFLAQYPVDRYPLSTSREPDFDRDLYDAVGLMLRDAEFVRIAERERLGRRPEVQNELRVWRNKWVQQELIRSMRDSMVVTDEEAMAFYEAHPRQYLRGQEQEVAPFSEVADDVREDVKSERLRTLMDAYLAELRQRFPVEIYTDVLDTLEVSGTGPPGTPDAFIFKGHTGRLAHPLVDPVW